MLIGLNDPALDCAVATAVGWEVRGFTVIDKLGHSPTIRTPSSNLVDAFEAIQLLDVKYDINFVPNGVPKRYLVSVPEQAGSERRLNCFDDSLTRAICSAAIAKAGQKTS